MKGDRSDFRYSIKWRRAFIPAVLTVCCLFLVVSGGCLDTLGNLTVNSGEGAGPAVQNSPVPSQSPSPSPFPKPSAGEQPTTPAVTAPVETSSAPIVMQESADEKGVMGDGVTEESGDLMNSVPPGTFSLAYTPPDGYVAEEGDVLEMQVRVVPGEGFSAPVSLRLDIAVPSPGLPFVTLWKTSYDLGTTSPPYNSVTYSLPLDLNSPPEEYEWVTSVARQAETLGITSFFVNVRVMAEGGGQTVSESPSYMVRLS